MTIPVLICDDSSFARKQMARSLPEHWDVTLSYAANGKEAMDVLHQGKAEIMFLDLNMPEMDGYEVLEAVRQEDLNILVIVVSGDVQPEARKRVKSLGAMDFIKKPVDKQEIHRILDEYGLLQLVDTKLEVFTEDESIDHFDYYKELANISMGRGIDLLSRLLGVFIPMPIPTVRNMKIEEVYELLAKLRDNKEVIPICQGFIGAGIAGEVLLTCNRPSLTELLKLMDFTDTPTESTSTEIIMDLASVLSGACLNGLTEQMDVAFSLGHPRVVGQDINIRNILESKVNQDWTQTLSIQMSFAVEENTLECDLLLLFTEDSMPKLEQLVSYMG
jgi:CheY-like chemotaxis protein